jgi:hypothetical protein
LAEAAQWRYCQPEQPSRIRCVKSIATIYLQARMRPIELSGA